MTNRKIFTRRLTHSFFCFSPLLFSLLGENILLIAEKKLMNCEWHLNFYVGVKKRSYNSLHIEKFKKNYFYIKINLRVMTLKFKISSLIIFFQNFPQMNNVVGCIFGTSHKRVEIRWDVVVVENNDTLMWICVKIYATREFFFSKKKQ